MRGPEVTVLMTVRNGMPFVREAVWSILRQTYEDFQFLILDNQSTDATPDEIRGICDPRIHYVRLDRDLGQTGALQMGLGLANGRYVARIDADDVARPDRLQRQLDVLRGSPGTALIGSTYQVIDHEGTVLRQHALPTGHDSILRRMLFENQFAHSAVTYSRQAALACGGYPSGYRRCQDFALWWQMALEHRVANIDLPLTQVRYHPDQATYLHGPELSREVHSLILSIVCDPRLPACLQPLAPRVRAYAELKLAAALVYDLSTTDRVRRVLSGLRKSPHLLRDRPAMAYACKALLGRRYDAGRALFCKTVASSLAP